MTSNAKIRPEHLARPAIVYVRQSTLGQVMTWARASVKTPDGYHAAGVG